MGLAYQGSKRRLLPVLKDLARKHSAGCSFYVEPFLGGANAIEANVYGLPMMLSDGNADLVCLYKALVDGWVPPDRVTRAEFLAAKRRDPSIPPHEIVWRLWMASFQKRYDTMFQTDPGKRGDLISRDLSKHAREAVYLGRVLAKATLVHSSYADLVIPSGAYVYCDPPYKGTADYAGKSFDSEAFYKWAESTASGYGRVVVVSEYNAPAHWPEVHRQELRSTVGMKHGDRTERVFLARSTSAVVFHG